MCACPCAKGKAPTPPPGQAPCQTKGGGCGSSAGAGAAPSGSNAARSSCDDNSACPSRGSNAAPPPSKRKTCGPKPCDGSQCGKCGKGGPRGPDPPEEKDPGKQGSGFSAPPNNRGPVALALAALLFAAGVFLTTRLGIVANEIG